MTDEKIDGRRTTCEILGRPVHQYPKSDADWINLKDLETGLLYRVEDRARVVDRTLLDCATAGSASESGWNRTAFLELIRMSTPVR